MALFIDEYGLMSARTERRPEGQLPFREWSGYVRPQPETGPIADHFYESLNQLKSVRKPNGSSKTVPLPEGLVAAGPLQPVNGISDLSPNLSLGVLNCRVADHRASGGGIDPDGSTYAFDLREQASMPRPDPGTLFAYRLELAGQVSIGGHLVVTHPDGQVDRLPAGGFLDTGTSNMFIRVPTLNGGRAYGADFKGSVKYGELRTKGGGQVVNGTFGQDYSGVLHIAPVNRFLLPGVKNIAIAMRYGRLTGGCIADDGTAYSFVLSGLPSKVTTIGEGF